MDEIVTGSFQLMKKINKTLILDIIRQHGPISRAEIAKMTRLTPPTVTNLVRDLLATNIVVEGERMNSTGGRKPIMLQINPRACFAIGVDVGISKITAVVTDLEANVMVKTTKDLLSGSNLSILDVIKETIYQVLALSEAEKDKFIGIGIGMHGLVNSQTGTSLFAPHFGLRNVPVKHLIEEEFRIPAYLDNDVRAMALGESWLGHGKDVENFIFVNVGMGIGAGIVFNHEVYHGIGHSAGEIGHTTVLEEGPLCSCGNHGCLEVLAAGPGIVARAREAAGEDGASSLSSVFAGRPEDVTAREIYEEAERGDRLAKEIIQETGKYLGIAIANAINMFNPELVVIGGGVANAGDLLLEPLIQTVLLRAMEVPAGMVKILPTMLGEDVGAIGAATLVLKTLFKAAKVS